MAGLSNDDLDKAVSAIQFLSSLDVQPSPTASMRSNRQSTGRGQSSGMTTGSQQLTQASLSDNTHGNHPSTSRSVERVSASGQQVVQYQNTSTAASDSDDFEDDDVLVATDRALRALQRMRGGMRGEKRKRTHKAEMSALFKRKSCKTETWKHKFVCLAFKDQVKSPGTVMEKDELLKCGLGEKEITFSNVNINREEFKSLLLSEFPQLREAGGYHLLKCIPNSRKLEILPSIVHNSPALLKKRVGGAKTFIRPIQRNLDVQPVIRETQSDTEPTEECLTCGLLYPISELQEHAETCVISSENSACELENGRDRDQNIANCDHALEEVPYETTADIESELIQIAIDQSLEEDTSSGAMYSNVQSIIRTLQSVCVEMISIEVRRECLLEDALSEAKKAKFSPVKILKTRFSLEPAVDLGGPRREFFRLLAIEARDKFFIGKEDCKFFSTDVKAVQDRELFALGQYCAASIVQGGNGFPFFAEQVFQYFVSSSCTGATILLDNVPYGILKYIIEKLHDAESDDDVRNIFELDEALETLCVTGYRKPVQGLTFEDRLSLESALIDYHCFLKVKAEMDQFVEGMGTTGVLSVIKNSPEIMREMFIAPIKSISADELKDMLTVDSCSYESPSNIRAAKQAWLFFSDYLDMCEDGTVNCTVSDVLSFFTGASSVPPLGFEKPLRVEFIFSSYHPLPTASTCDLILRIPTMHGNRASFVDVFYLAIKGHGGFGQV